MSNILFAKVMQLQAISEEALKHELAHRSAGFGRDTLMMMINAGYVLDKTDMVYRHYEKITRRG